MDFHGFLCLSCQISSRILSPDFPFFDPEKCPEKSSRKILQNKKMKPLKIPDAFPQRGRAKCWIVGIPRLSYLLDCPTNNLSWQVRLSQKRTEDATKRPKLLFIFLSAKAKRGSLLRTSRQFARQMSQQLADIL